MKEKRKTNIVVFTFANCKFINDLHLCRTPLMYEESLVFAARVFS